jgi:DNA-binding SARP family transcriptional activator/Flp pilus assembly protein TadD
VESARPPSLEVRLLGPLAIRRRGAALALPASRKVRALLAYLALAPHAVARGHLCELLWDVPNDPRGELRWCLSKIRGLVDEPGRRRVQTEADTVSLDLAGCSVDAVEVARAAAARNFGTTEPERLRALAASFAGDFLAGLEVDRSPAFDGWLAAQRRRFRGWHAALLEHLAGSVPDDEAFGHLERWLELAPFDQRVHGLLLDALARRGRIREGEQHVAATVRLFEAEGLDAAPVRDAWRSARARGDRSTGTPAAVPAVTAVAAAAAGDPDGTVAAAPRRASIAVMPFVDHSAAAGARGGAADALAHDVITRLAKLRGLFVIAQGTVFALHERQVGPEEASRMLGVDYVVGGAVQHRGERLAVSIELTEVATARIVWAEAFDYKRDDTLLVLDGIGDRIVASIAGEIETIERNRAVLRPPSSLDAWGAHHRGLWHMYRFNKADNELARHFFETAVRLDPTFARAHAGLSFTHLQNAYQGWTERGPEADRAFEAAGRSLMADERDPAAHWAMGRALWLRGRHDQSVAELEQSVELSPSFALGHYGLALVHSKAGDPSTAIASSDRARDLSPFDPLLFAMLEVRATALVRLGRFGEAADWSAKAAARPNAHAHVVASAAFSLALAGRLDEARACMASVHKTLPRYRVDDFLAAMRLAPEGEKLFREGARLIGAQGSFPA